MTFLHVMNRTARTLPMVSGYAPRRLVRFIELWVRRLKLTFANLCRRLLAWRYWRCRGHELGTLHDRSTRDRQRWGRHAAVGERRPAEGRSLAGQDGLHRRLQGPRQRASS